MHRMKSARGDTAPPEEATWVSRSDTPGFKFKLHHLLREFGSVTRLPEPQSHP